MNQSRLQEFVEWLLDNVFDIATILVAGFLVARYQITSPTPDDIPAIVTWILGVLGLIAVSGLWERNRRLHRIEKLSEEGRNLSLRYLSRRTYASDFFLSERRLTAKDFSSANTIYFVGMVLSRTTREFMYVLGQRLVAGAKIRFVVLDFESEMVLQQAYLQSFNAPIEFWRDNLKTTETVIEAIAKTSNSKGTVELGYLPYVPSFGITLIDPDQAHGTCFVELYQHRSAEPHPTFEVRATDDPHWYKFFQGQFDRLWESCRYKTFDTTKNVPPQ
ncbi:MAG: hypothetical protein IT314_03420 [Anaerolineales bacterium]|nr:hypothetical protein [Anaerolineales bacterium]